MLHIIGWQKPRTGAKFLSALAGPKISIFWPFEEVVQQLLLLVVVYYFIDKLTLRPRPNSINLYRVES